MKKILLALLFGICLFPLKANHIVGGEIEFLYVRDGVYRINLIQYFDEAQSLNPGPEAAIQVYIFRSSDNAQISIHTLTLSSQELVEYTNIECAIDELITSRVVWSAEVNLNPNLYSDPEGYYISWERCCRNAAIKNIVTPIGAGMTYTLDIPPLMINGKVFINSSPILFKPLSDYACVNQLYYIEFTGTDPDGDSLVYSLTTPLNSSAAVALPTPTPKPHGKVAFNPGFSESNMIPGSRPLAISNKGLLTVTPAETGLYVFSVLVEEYRNKQKIGQTRRDFQMLVVDGCEPPDPPVVDIDIPGDPDFDPLTDVLTYTVADAKCFDFLVANVTDGETISFRAEGVNFDEELNDIFQLNQIPVGSGMSELKIEVCVPDCPPVSDGAFILDLIASDDACPLPQLDTLRLTIVVEPPPNIFPSSTTAQTTVIQQESNAPIYSHLITGMDPDGDEMRISLLIDGVEDPTAHGFGLDTLSSTPGNIQALFTWDTDCEMYDFSSDQQFRVGILVDDLDECDVSNPDTLFVDATVILPPNTNPVVSSSAISPNRVMLGTQVNFDVSVSDSDNDDVTLTLVGGNFDPNFYGVDFTTASGNTNASSSFSWDVFCDTLLFPRGHQFEMLFIGDDDDKCKVKNFDTLRYVIEIEYPENAAPVFEEISQNRVVRVNERTQFEIEAFDPDGDQLTLELAPGFRQPPSNSLSFEPITGNGRVSGIFEWQPECSLLRFGQTSALEDVVFQVKDSSCTGIRLDTLKITFELIDDAERQTEFLPPNVFTPNGDDVNDLFTLSGHSDRTQNLPPNNCDNSFEFIVINNRAGNTVFRSENRDFAWSGGQFPTGVYYYLIKYSTTEFKGFVHLLR
ncbi:MAG: gliding motility-associated C-terminal domain-containing protein [Cyclobacteriaceae bacterium]